MSPLQKKQNLRLKRVMDIVLSLAVVVLVFPWLIPLLAIIIKSDSAGPVFFLQKRNKRGGQIFTCIKFRTMRPNKEADTLPAMENDERITRVGKVLRASHLDELPQLWNVLTGDMSLVGPRPYMISDNRQYARMINDYVYRHSVKPGITGPAQILGYGGAVTDKAQISQRIKLDIFYINYWSPRLDMAILFYTLKRLFAGQARPARSIAFPANSDHGALVSN